MHTLLYNAYISHVMSPQLAMKATVQDVIGLVQQAFQDVLYN